MSIPQTNYIVGSLDLSGIFQPYTSGNNSVTGYKISSGQDLSGIFQPYISGNQALPTNYFVYNYNGLGITKDLNDIFAPYNIITPSGGTSTSSGGYTIVSFTETSGSININSTVPNTFYYLVVGGGGPGGGDQGGGGGGGGVVQNSFPISSGLNTINIIVGAGGIITFTTSTENGKDSSLSYGATTITANGGGYGGWASGFTSYNQAANGGCGGGAGTGTTIVGTGTQGQNGGSSSVINGGGGGGGMTLVGVNGTSTIGGNGGNGIQCSQPGINLIYPSTYWGGGGGGGIIGLQTGGNGGLGGGGGGASSNTGGLSPGTQGVGGSGLNSGQNGISTKGGNGGTNTGGGGGGGPQLNSGGNGGSGIVVIAYLTP